MRTGQPKGAPRLRHHGACTRVWAASHWWCYGGEGGAALEVLAGSIVLHP